MKHETSLKKKTIGGLLWSFGDLMGNQGIQFIIQIILARMLVPEHFGLIGMILIFIAVSNSIVDSGFTQALIREQHATQKDYSTVFYSNMFISLIIYACLFIAAPAISNFFGEAELVAIIRILSLGIIINAFAIVPRAMFTKEINFKSQAKVNMTASIVSGAVAITMAFLDFGVWSLVFRTLVMNFGQSFLLSFAKKWLPSLVFSLTSFKKLFGFGWKLLVAGLIDTIYTNIYFLIIGRQYSAGQLGYYTNASRFSDIASQTLTSTIQRVTYPVLSSIQDQKVRLKQSFRKIIKLSAFLIFPVMVGIAAIGDPLVHIVFGAQWQPMIIYFQLLCIAGMLYPIHAVNLSVLQVKGRSDLFLYLEIVKMVVLTVLLIIAISLNFGILGLVGVVILDSHLALFINTYFSGREISYPVKEQMKDIFPIYALALVMGAVVYGAGEWLDDPYWLLMLKQISIGIVFYITFAKLLKIQELKIVFDLLAPMVKKIK